MRNQNFPSASTLSYLRGQILDLMSEDSGILFSLRGESYARIALRYHQVHPRDLGMRITWHDVARYERSAALRRLWRQLDRLRQEPEQCTLVFKRKFRQLNEYVQRQLRLRPITLHELGTDTYELDDFKYCDHD